MINQYELINTQDDLLSICPIRRLETEDINPKTNNVFDIMTIINENYLLTKLNREYLFVIAFDEFDKLLGVYLNNVGNEKSVDNDYKRLFSFLIIIKSSSFILIHNHPNDCKYATEGDIESYFETKNIADKIGLYLKGSYIICQNGYVNCEDNSFTEFYKEIK